MNTLINQGTSIINKSGNPNEPKTVIVIGVARGGTSMTAHVLHNLNIDMGSKTDPYVMEDMEISQLLEQENNIEKIIELVNKKNSNFEIWGWKRPMAFKYINKYLEYIRNPYFIVMFRDSFSISLRNSISIQAELLQNLKETHQYFHELIDFISNTDKPCLLISNEKALLKKENFVNSIIDFLNINPSSENIKKAVESIQLDKADYLNASRAIYRGVVDSVYKGIVKGWAQQEESNTPLNIDIFVDNVNVKTVSASKFRPDLKNNNIGNGNHAFIADISEFLAEDKVYNVQVKIQRSNFELKNSPIQALGVLEKFTKLFFMHVPKAAGSSLNDYFASNYSDDRVCTHIEGNPTWRNENLRENCDFISGHVKYIDISKIVNLEQHIKISILREPLKQLISHISWVKHISDDRNSKFYKNHPEPIKNLSLKIRNIDFSDIKQVVEFIDGFGYLENRLFNNCQTRYFIDDTNIEKLTEEHAKKAISNLSHFDIVGTVEQFDKFTSDISKIMIWQKPTETKILNVLKNKIDLDLQNPEILKILNRLIIADKIFYDHVFNLNTVD